VSRQRIGWIRFSTLPQGGQNPKHKNCDYTFNNRQNFTKFFGTLKNLVYATPRVALVYEFKKKFLCKTSRMSQNWKGLKVLNVFAELQFNRRWPYWQ
jgi:hypothetical protein